jgi:tetratricopeptide (TPR) repeat protein
VDWLEILGWSEEEIEDLRATGYSYIQQGVYSTALQFFEALIILDPANAYDQETLGALYLQTGKGLQALDQLDGALKLDAENLQTQLNRAKALFMLGYRRQGLLQAMELEKCSDPTIASQASALVLAYR